MTHPISCLESSPTPSHMHMPSVKTVIGVSPNDLTHWTTLQYLFNFIKSCLFLWVANFQGLTADFTRPPTLSRTFIAEYICLTKNKIWVFHLVGGGEIYPILLHPNTRDLLLLLFYTHESQFWMLSQFPSSLHIHQEW